MIALLRVFLFLTLGCVVLQAKKGASNRVPLGQVRINNVQISQKNKLAGPGGQLEKSERIEAAKALLEKKMEARERSEAKRKAAVAEKKRKDAELSRKVKSSVLFRAIRLARSADVTKDEDEDEE